MFLVYPPHVLHEPRQLGVVLRELRAPRLGQGGIRPSAVVLDGPLELRNDRVVEAPRTKGRSTHAFRGRRRRGVQGSIFVGLFCGRFISDGRRRPARLGDIIFYQMSQATVWPQF